jgi:hypothetical protein
MVVTLYLDTGIGFLEPNDRGGGGRYLRANNISIYRFFDDLFDKRLYWRLILI